MAQVELLDGKNLDYEAFVRTQKKAFAELLKEMKASDSHMTPEYYRWKYNTPFGEAKIAVVREGGEILSSVSMLPMPMKFGGETLIAWQCLDTATIPEARGKGYFRATGDVLLSAVPQEELSFGFPNKNVIRGWSQSGWTYKQLVTTWICPLAPVFQWNSPRVIALHRWDARQDVFQASLPFDDYPMVERSSAYLNWRYAHHPLHQYSIFSFENSKGGIAGTVVARMATVMNRRAVLVMDLLGTSPGVELTLLRKVCSWATRQKCPFLVLLDSALSKVVALHVGLVPIWSKVLPKKQIIMGKAGSEEAPRRFYQRRWRIQLGDWDVF